MTITEKQKKQVQKEFDKVISFCTEECVQTVLEHFTEEVVQDSQTLYDCIADLMIGVDLTKLVLERLKKALEVK